jgi:DHA1 family tetracycline resistance protein-like MFS transporter
MTARKPGLLFIFFTLVLDTLGIGLIIPVGPKLVASVMGLDPHGGTAVDNAVALPYGLLAATYAAMQFVFAPILGSLSDRFGRRPVILIALFGSGLDYLVAAFAPALWVLFVTRALNGLSGANFTACNAYIADVTTPEKRAAGYGIAGAAFGIGFVAGPLIGGWLGQHGPHYPFLAAGVLSLCNWLYGLFVLPESLPPEKRGPFSWRKANPVGALPWLAKNPIALPIAAALFLSQVGQFALHSTWVLSMGYRFKWNEMDVAWSLVAVGIGAGVVQGGLARQVIPRVGERACLLGGFVIGVFGFLGYALAPQGWMIYAVIAGASIGGLAGPAAQAINSRSVSPTEQGLLQGALASLTCIAAVAGPLIGSALFKHFTREGLEHPLPGAPFLAGAALTLLALIPIAVVWRRVPATPKAQAPAASL